MDLKKATAFCTIVELPIFINVVFLLAAEAAKLKVLFLLGKFHVQNHFKNSGNVELLAQ